MAHSNVSSCVLSIVASFYTGLDVCKKLREKRRKKSRSRSSTRDADDEDHRLVKSLRQGPEEIGREYQRSVHVFGDRCAVGDAIAQTSLADILLKLNTGLASIITLVPVRDRKDVQADYAHLTALSEQSRNDTCWTLRELFQRLCRDAKPPHLSDSRSALSHSARLSIDASDDERKRKRKPAPKSTSKPRGPTLARVVIQDSSKPAQIAMVKPSVRSKRSNSTNTATKLPSNYGSGASAVWSTPPPPYEPADKFTPPTLRHSHTSPDMKRPHPKRSTANVRAPVPMAKPDALRETKSTPRLHPARDTHHSEPLPPLPGLISAPLTEPRRLRQPTPTYYSIASDSTKLGEIPLHRWAVPPDFDAMSLMNRRAKREGWPVPRKKEVDEGRRGKWHDFLRLFRGRNVGGR